MASPLTNTLVSCLRLHTRRLTASQALPIRPNLQTSVPFSRWTANSLIPSKPLRPSNTFSSFHTSRPRTQRYQRFGDRRQSKQQQQSQDSYRTRLPLPQGIVRLIALLNYWASRPGFYYQLAGLGGAGGAFYVYNLEDVPISGRRRFNCVSPEREAAMGVGQVQDILQQYQGRVLPEYDPRVRQVKRVIERLTPASGMQDASGWEVHVLDSEETNAFVVPGGHVFVFTGILPVCGNDDGLATVLAHEIGHNVAHHIAEKMSRNFIFQGLIFLGEILQLCPQGLSNLFITFIFELPSSRAEESEADYIGLMMMSQSCYDPSAAVAFWDRMEKATAQQGAPPQFLSTHPSSHNRQEKLREWQPQAQEKLASSECGSTTSYLSEFKQSLGGQGQNTTARLPERHRDRPQGQQQSKSDNDWF